MIKVSNVRDCTYAVCLECGATYHSTRLYAEKYLTHKEGCTNNPSNLPKSATKAEEAVDRAWEKNR